MIDKTRGGVRAGLMFMALEAGMFLPGIADNMPWTSLFPLAAARAAKQKADPHGMWKRLRWCSSRKRSMRPCSIR